MAIISMIMELIGEENFNEYTLTATDIKWSGLLFFGILAAAATAAKIVISEQKKLAWIISLVNSLVMMTAGIVYLIAKVPDIPDFFMYGDLNRIEVFHAPTTNFTALACLWFAIANVFDLVFGLVFYRKYLGILTAYVHHSVFIWLCFAGTTGNGLFMTVKPFSSGFLLCLVEEVPTFLLALGSIFPELRTNYGFGLSFFLLRIVYHAYFTTFAFYSGAELPVLVLFLMTSVLHINWFQNWIQKYGPLATYKSKV